jgi:hypothetical protein
MPAGSTYSTIATTTLGGSTTSYTFSSIPQTYTDLILVHNGVASTEAGSKLQFNSDTGTNYSYTLLDGAPGSGRGTNRNWALIGNFFNDRDMKIINIFNYSNTTTFKTLISRSGYISTGTYGVSAWVNTWRSTSAITSLTIGPDTGSMNSGTTLTLYGIAAA